MTCSIKIGFGLFGSILTLIFHKLTGALTFLLIPQENFSLSTVITDKLLLRKIPCETNTTRSSREFMKYPV